MSESHTGVQVIRVDPLNPLTGVFFHPTLARVKEFAARHFPEVDPDVFSREVASKVATEAALLLALVEESTGKVVGHALATVEGYEAGNGARHRWVSGIQFRADTEAGEQLQRQTARLIAEWGVRLGAQSALLMVRRSDIGWMKKDDWRPARVVVHKDLTREGVNGE